jgi:hypothetical protein
VSIQKRDFLDKVKEREDCNPGGKYIEVFRGLQSECDAACHAIALETAEDCSKGAFLDGNVKRNP